MSKPSVATMRAKVFEAHCLISIRRGEMRRDAEKGVAVTARRDRMQWAGHLRKDLKLNAWSQGWNLNSTSLCTQKDTERAENRQTGFSTEPLNCVLYC